MATIEIKDIPGEKESQFFHKSENLFYQRVIAGISSPTEKPGAIVVLGEEVSWRPPFQVYWLAEVQAPTIDELIQRAIELKANFKISDLPMGTYNVVAYFREADSAAGYSIGRYCDLNAECDHALIPIEIRPNAHVMNIDPVDWYAPIGTFPPDPTM